MGGEGRDCVMAEPVRDTIKRSMRQVRGEPEPDEDDVIIGLVENPDDVAFQCATCNHFEDGICQKDLSALKGQPVEGKWCCNWYEHPKMRTIIGESNGEEAEKGEEGAEEGEKVDDDE